MHRTVPRFSPNSVREGDDVFDRLDPRRSDDELVAFTLIQTWILTTGRALRPDVVLTNLSTDDLIEFWADPYTDPDCEA